VEVWVEGIRKNKIGKYGMNLGKFLIQTVPKVMLYYLCQSKLSIERKKAEWLVYHFGCRIRK
jgi:hypothetical protein